MGETGGALFVGGAGLLGSGYGVYDGAGALGEWIGSENLSIVEKLELSLRIGNAALGTVTGPFAGLGLFRSGTAIWSAGRIRTIPNNYPLANYYPSNNGFWGKSNSKLLLPGEQFDRFGSLGGFYASPVNTPLSTRSLPPRTNTNIYNILEVIKPFKVQSGTVAPAFGELGFGKQYLTPMSMEDLLQKGMIKIIK